jgi:hypothetical protein
VEEQRTFPEHAYGYNNTVNIKLKEQRPFYAGVDGVVTVPVYLVINLRIRYTQTHYQHRYYASQFIYVYFKRAFCIRGKVYSASLCHLQDICIPLTQIVQGYTYDVFFPYLRVTLSRVNM